jgi:asparagine synthase (glutamine-hydrolysing)
MCGIWLLLSTNPDFHLTCEKLYKSFMKIKGRGPENSFFKTHDNIGLIVGFHRLAINGTYNISADQPFVSETNTTITYAICNGEIYNYKQLAQKYNIILTSGSDCEILTPLYQKIGMDAMMKEIKGEFATIICEIDKTTHQVKLSVGRDKCGVRPMFIANSNDTIVFSSELKGIPEAFLNDDKYNVQQFPPRHHLTVTSKDQLDKLNFAEYLNFSQIKPTVFDFEEAKKLIRDQLVESVESHMMSDREVACLLSGGLDSSLVSAIAAGYYKKQGKKLRTFCIGIDKDATDIKYAQMVADHIGSNHTTIILPEEHWLNAVKKVIYTIESYDITTVRASTGQYLVAKWIAENTDIKVLLIGDGADEVAFSYLYSHSAPSKDAFHQECLKLVNNIHFFDALRSDRGISSNGIEARVPFLEEFAEAYLSISLDLRYPTGTHAGVEKYLIREAFRDTERLPHEVLFRQKEAFSDGVSTKKRSWFSILQENIANMYTDEDFEVKRKKYVHNTPPSHEALYYRESFEEYFGDRETVAKVIPYFWMPNPDWCGHMTEPSARVLKHYDK